MSMPAWLNDVPAVSNNDNGAFNPSVDPAVAFMQTPTSANFDFNQLQNPQLQQRMQNGIARNGSPAFANPAYQTQPVVPSKRPRGASDMYGASPRQAPGALPSSRSQTPQQAPYGGAFHGNINGSHPMQAPTPYQHLQHGGSSNASPSPVMQDQHFNPQVMSQRMQTVSPSPFSPAAPPNYGSQVSPPQSDYGSRVDTPQNGGHPYLPGMPYGGVPPQHFTPPPGSGNNGVQSNASVRYAQNTQAMQQQQQQRIQEMRHQQHLARQIQASNEEAAHRHQGGMLSASPAQMAHYQQAAARAQQMQQAVLRQQNPEQFLRQLTQFMNQRGMPFNANPSFSGRPIHPAQLWTVVMKHGGSKKVSAGGGWPAIAGMFQLQYPTAAEELQSYWGSNLYHWEQLLQSFQQSQQRHRPTPNQAAGPPLFQGDNLAIAPDQFSPVKQLHSQNQGAAAMIHARRQSAADFQTPTKPINPQQQQAHLNGYGASSHNHPQNQSQNAFSIVQHGIPAQAQHTHPHVHQPPYTTPARNSLKREPHTEGPQEAEVKWDENTALERCPKHPIGEEFQPNWDDKWYEHIRPNPLATHGGYAVDDFDSDIAGNLGFKQKGADGPVLGMMTALADFVPVVPKIHELGLIDIRALTMSLRSGIHAEVRLALDTLATISGPPPLDVRPMHLLLEDCEELVETLVDCAEEQVEFLAESAAEVSDVMLISPYEDVLRGCRSEMLSLVDVPEFGSLEYDLDRAVERLLCISTILRNLSDLRPNHRLLADPIVVRLMTTVIRYLGTRNMLLRTHRNTLDFTKDVLTFLSNVSQVVDLPGKEEALCILHFLLSFAPSPSPITPGIEGVMFSSYNPSLHRYLPAAVDSLAKLLARDDPNRTFYKSILTADSTTNPPYDLLTRTFGLAIAPIPNHSVAQTGALGIRKPFIAQGILAADILVTLIPSTEHTLARSWLMSQDGFALSLLRLISMLIVKDQSPRQVMQPTRQGQPVDEDAHDWVVITIRGISILRNLAERTKDIDSQSGSIPTSVLPNKDILLRALRTATVDRNVLRQLCAYAGLES
ncbi:hypothetical protein MMC30_006645 [Trapelia coarctata]|nr:hypothetical protein [Trapelia coarctata]